MIQLNNYDYSNKADLLTDMEKDAMKPPKEVREWYSQMGKKSAERLTKEERIERARKAGLQKGKKK